MIRRLCVIGVGLIGGSLARALRQAGYCRDIVGAGRDPQHLQQAVTLGVIDRYETDLARAVQDADMVVVSVPLGAMQAVFAAIRDHLAEDAVVTDAGSAKASVVADARAAFGKLPAGFVPGHPIAGTEQSGVAASFPDLYRDKRVILTPTDASAAEAVARVRAMWEATGAQVTEMSAEHHDEVLAATSHLPHLLAFALVESLARLQDQREMFEYAAGGFRDFTRIASSDPVMWRDICLANRTSLHVMIERFSADLQELDRAMCAGDGERLLQLFSDARRARDRYVGK
jgi:prephenate dehydrogenase